MTDESLQPDATLAAVVAYDGAPFNGFARQPGQPTVQGELEQALELLLRRPVELTCAGRTDAGVHARGQVVSFDVASCELGERSLPSLVRSLNALTPDGIAVRSLAARPLGFSARFDAVSREYRYFIALGATPPLFMERWSWHVAKDLDEDAMVAAAAHLIGEHDFKSFCLAASAEGQRTWREVTEISFTREEVMGEPALAITVTGNAFLHSMVRTIVGTLAMVGRGKRSAEWVADVLAARDRTAAGESAPARGLVLWEVRYG